MTLITKQLYPTIITGIILLLSSCNQNPIIEYQSKPIDQPVDTTTQYAVYTLKGPTIDRSKLPTGLNYTFTPTNIDMVGPKLYVANTQGYRIDVFNVETLTPIYSLADSVTSGPPYQNMQPYDVYADNQYMMIASVNPQLSQIYVYNATNYKYVNRIGGDGQNTGILDTPFSLTANGQYVFVRDMTPQVKVFLRNQITLGATVYSTLETVNTTPQIDQNFDMAITGDTLIALDTKTRTIELYKLSQITQGNPLKPFQTIVVQDALPLSLTTDKTEIYFSVYSNLQTYIVIYDIKEFIEKQELQIPTFAFYQSGDYNYLPMTSLRVRDNTMLFNQNDQRIEIVKLKKVIVDIYDPKSPPEK